MPKRFWAGFAAGYLILVAAYAGGWALNPIEYRATAGLSETGGLPPRIGLVGAIMVLPVVLTALRLARIRDPRSPAHLVLPVLLACALFVVAFFVGFMPDEIGCNMFNLERFGPLDPECTTAPGVRLEAVAEATVLWALFGGLCALAGRLAARRQARRT